MNTDAGAVPSRARTSWNLTPAGAWSYAAAVIAIAFLAPKLALVGWLIAIVLAFYVHADLRDHDQPTFGWTFAVVLLGFLAFIPYTYRRRAWASDDIAFEDGDDTAHMAEDRPQVVGPTLIGIGAACAFIAAFLPVIDTASVDFIRVKGATLLAGGDGWILIAIAAVAAITIWRAFSGRRGFGWLALVCGVVAIALAIADSSTSSRQIYPLDENGNVNILAPSETADPGSGIYLAGVAGGFLLLGGMLTSLLPPTRRPFVAAAAPAGAVSGGGGPTAESPAARELEATRPTKQCPDCAEYVLSEARLCRFCRHVFDDVAPLDPA